MSKIPSSPRGAIAAALRAQSRALDSLADALEQANDFETDPVTP